MRKRWAERSFLEEKLMRVGEALQQLKKDEKIKWFLRSGSFRFARRMGIDFYIVYIDSVKYIARPLWVTRNYEGQQNDKPSIKINLFESQGSIQRKILETIKRL